MGESEWAFLLDENIGRTVQQTLADRGYPVDHVVDVLTPGADDLPDVLPYARENDLVVVTKDYSDFSAIEDHEGILLIVDHAYPPHTVVDAIEEIIDTYPSRDAFRSQQEYLDRWVTQ